MRIDPEKSAVAGQVLKESQTGHDDRRAGNPAQHSLNIGHSLQTLVGHDEQHTVHQQHAEPLAGCLRGQGDLSPGSQGQAGIGSRGPEGQQIRQGRAEPLQDRRGQRAQLQHQQSHRQQDKPFATGPAPVPAALQPLRDAPGGRDDPDDARQDDPAHGVSPTQKQGSDQQQRQQSSVSDAPQEPNDSLLVSQWGSPPRSPTGPASCDDMSRRVVGWWLNVWKLQRSWAAGCYAKAFSR